MMTCQWGSLFEMLSQRWNPGLKTSVSFSDGWDRTGGIYQDF